jgi:hypothetical protein
MVAEAQSWDGCAGIDDYHCHGGLSASDLLKEVKLIKPQDRSGYCRRQRTLGKIASHLHIVIVQTPPGSTFITNFFTCSTLRLYYITTTQRLQRFSFVGSL